MSEITLEQMYEMQKALDERIIKEKGLEGQDLLPNTVLALQVEIGKCDWCGEPADELSHPHMFDMAIGKRMCRVCWDHDREVYKGSYGEDIGDFKPIGGEKDD